MIYSGLYPGEYIEYFNKTGKTALHEATQYGQLEIARILLEKGI